MKHLFQQLLVNPLPKATVRFRVSLAPEHLDVLTRSKQYYGFEPTTIIRALVAREAQNLAKQHQKRKETKGENSSSSY